MARFFSYLVFMLLLVTRLQLCTSEPLTLVAIGVISGVMGIIDFISSKINTINEVEGGESESLSIYDLKYQLDLMTEEIITAVNDANKVQTLKDRLHEATDAIDQIDEWFKDMVVYNKTLSSKDPDISMIKEASSRLDSGPNGPRFYLRQIYNLFFDEGDENILKLIADIKKGYTGTCSSDTSLQTVQQVYQKYYVWTAIAAAKTYLMTLVAVNILEKSKNNAHADVVELTKRTVLEKDKESVEVLKKYMRIASRDVWRCDPDQQIEDVTYTQLHRLFQKYFIQEHDLGVNINMCGGSCLSLGNPAITNMCNPEDKNSVVTEYSEHGVYTRPGTVYDKDSGTLCRNQRTCSGGLWDCENFGIDYRLIKKSDFLKVCNSDRNSNRRYDYAVKTYGREGDVTNHWGREENCKEFTSRTAPHLVLTHQCEVCVCTCAEDSSNNPDKYISLEPVYSATDKNRVVTGARLVKKNNAIRIEIEEGTLGKIATIVNNSASWITSVYQKPTKQDVDNRLYHQIRWDEGRAISLGDALTPKDHAIVGLAFEYTYQYGLYLVIYSRPFNFTSGELLLQQNERTSPPLPAASTLKLEDRDVSTLSSRKSSVSETNKVITLTTTGLKQDIGQNVIPFWDIQVVTTTMHSPMSGAGLYYKSCDVYGGFLGLKLYTYDIEPHFDVTYHQKSTNNN